MKITKKTEERIKTGIAKFRKVLEIDECEIRKLLSNSVLKRGILDDPRVNKAQQRVTRFDRQCAKKA